jgi:hypothetical protein
VSDPERRRGLIDRQAPEEAQLDHARMPLVHRGKPDQRVFELDQIQRLRPRATRDQMLVEGEAALATAALLSRLRAGVIRQDPAHRQRREGEELSAVAGSAEVAAQLEPDFVDQRRRLQRVRLALVGEEGLGEAAQLAIDERQQRADRIGIPALQLLQQHGDGLGIEAAQVGAGDEVTRGARVRGARRHYLPARAAPRKGIAEPERCSAVGPAAPCDEPREGETGAQRGKGAGAELRPGAARGFPANR